MRLKELREERNLTQNDVAVAIQTSQRNIGRWENHSNEPSSSFVIKLADFFQVSTDYLLGRTDDFGNLVNGNSAIVNRQPSELSGNRDKYLVDFEKYFKLLTEIQKAQVLGYVMGLLDQNGIRINSI